MKKKTPIPKYLMQFILYTIKMFNELKKKKKLYVQNNLSERIN